MTDGHSSEGMTMKELIMGVGADVKALSAKLDTFIQGHEARHGAEQVAAITAMSDPSATAAGRRIVAEVNEIVTEKTKQHTEYEHRLDLIETKLSNSDAVAKERSRAASNAKWLVGIISGFIGAVVSAVLYSALAHPPA